MEDRGLIQEARNGDHAAFLSLLKQYDRQVMSVIYRFTADLYDRQDLYQDIFLACFKSIRQFRFKSSFATWLYRLALNQSITFMKKHAPTAEAQDGPDPAPGQGSELERRARLSAIRKALSRLKGPQQICFHLYYIEDWGLEEIATVLNCRVGTIKSHLNRARTHIRMDEEVLLWQTGT